MNILLVKSGNGGSDADSGYLESRGYNVMNAFCGNDAVQLSAVSDFTVIDLNLPDVDGFGLAGIITSRNRMPVLFLTESGSDDDIARALDFGGDYVKKPYSSKELCLRIEDMLQKADPEHGGIVRLPPMFIDTRRICVRVGNTELFLTPREYSLLMLLCGSPNKTFTNEELFKSLWGDGEVSTHLVQQNVSTLRRKLEKAAPGIRFIRTVHGSGYVFQFPPEQANR